MNPKSNQAILIADLGYGDAGKGSIVDYLTRITPAHTIVRYNGGAQAAHNVIAPDGRHHTFAQFGSGTFVPGVKTHLSRFMLIHPLAFLAEERHLDSIGLKEAFSRLSIERQALVITPFQQSANRLKEIARGNGRHGSCGMGVGETMSDWLAYGPDVLFAGDLGNRANVLKKLRFLQDAKIAQLESLLGRLPEDKTSAAELRVLLEPETIEFTADVFTHFAGQVKIVEPDYLGQILKQPGTTIFEGAQGVLLDEWWGFYPYNSWSTLTYKNAGQLLAENNFDGNVLKLGLLRGYATRHGAGPFVTQDPVLTAQVQDWHNEDNPWQRDFRVGYVDLLALRYAVEVTGRIDGLVITNLDRMEAIPDWQVCNSYRYPGENPHLPDYFHCQGQSIQAIKVPADPTDLARQEALTRLLLEMQPVYERCEHDRGAYVDLISQALKLPVAILSYGPTAREKEALFIFQKGIEDKAEVFKQEMIAPYN